MKKLHLVGFTPDNDGLILSPRKSAKSGSYVVALDDELMSSIEQARQVREGGASVDAAGEDPHGDARQRGEQTRRARPRSALSPREIQARLRAGSTTAEVAAQAGVDEEWVLRFADPILAEQAQVVERARSLTFAKSRLGPSALPLGESVQWNLSDRGVHFSDDVFADSWSAYNLHGARWAVRLSYTSRQRRQVAEWEVDLRARSLAARNRLASDLGHVEAGRRRARHEPSDHPPEPAPAAAKASDRHARKTAAASKRAPSAKAAASKRAPRTKVAAAEKSVARKSGRESSPRKSRPAKKPAPDKPQDEGRPDAAAPTVEPVPDRPSHLARPPSPMKMANRAPPTLGRRAPNPYPPATPPRTAAATAPPLPPSASPAPEPPSPAPPSPSPPPQRPAPPPSPPERRRVARPGPPDTAAEPEPTSSARTEPPRPVAPPPPVVPSRPVVLPPPAARPRPVAPPIRRPPPPAGPGGDDDDERPAVVILSGKPPEPPPG